MAAIESIISDIENRWNDVASEMIGRTIEKQQLSEVYVAGFWLFYFDYSAFYPPYLSINTKDLFREAQANGNHYRWSPPEWKTGLDDATDVLASDYEPLTEALADQSDETWDEAIEAHYQAIARVCRRLTTDFRSTDAPGGVSKHFVAGIFEERESDELHERLVRMSIDDSILTGLPEPTWGTDSL